MKQTLIVFGILNIVVMIMSCSSEPKRWYKAGGTEAMYERDASDCQDTLIDVPVSGSRVETYTFESCMEQKGWVVLDTPAM